MAIDPSMFGEEERLLRQILSPAEAQSLVLPPPDHPPASGPAESTPLTGNLRRKGLAAHFASPQPPDRAADPRYVKVSSNGQVGYLPKANLTAAQQIDKNLKVLD